MYDAENQVTKGYLALSFGDSKDNQGADNMDGFFHKSNWDYWVNLSMGFDQNGEEILTRMESTFCSAEFESSKAPSFVLSAGDISILFGSREKINRHTERLYPTVVKMGKYFYLYTYDKDGKTAGVQTNHGIGFSDSSDLCNLQLAQFVYHKDMTMLEFRGENHRSIFWDKKDADFVYLYDPRHIDSRYTLSIPVNEGEKGKFNQLLDLARTSGQTIIIPFPVNQWVKDKIKTKVDINQQGVSNNSKAVKKLPLREGNSQSGSNKVQKVQVLQKLKSKKSKDNEFYCRMTAQGPMVANLPPAKQSERDFVEQHTAMAGHKVGCFTIEVAGAVELQQEGNGYQYDIPDEILALRNFEGQPRNLAIDCNANDTAVPVLQVQVHDQNYQCAIGANRQKITIFLKTRPNNREIEFSEFFDNDDNVVGFSELLPWGSQGGAVNVAPYRVTNHSDMFRGASSLEYVQMNVEDSYNLTAMFSGADSFTGDSPDSNIARWDTENVTYTFTMFSDAPLFNADIGGWNMSRVQNMSEMFIDNLAFNQDIGGWNTANVRDMSSMFQNAENFSQDIGDWNTSRVTDMAGMFADAVTFNQNISTWDVSSVTDMRSMFQGARNFNQNISTWLVHNVQQCAQFARASGLADMQELLGELQLIYRFDLIPFSPRYFWDNCR
jgi:surface protein